jgi:hypothetical protein
MVHTSTLVVTADGKHRTSGGFILGETIRFGSMEFITERFGSLSLSDEWNDSGTVFVGMAHSGSPLMHTILEDSADEGDTSSNGGGSSGFPISQGCNMLTLTVPITTTSPLEGTLMPLTILTVPLRAIILQTATGVPFEQQLAYQEE